MIAVVIFGIFLALSYFIFQDQTKNVLASVLDGVEDVTGIKIGKTLDGTMNISGTGGPIVVAQNPESDFTFTTSTGTITAYNGTRTDVIIPDTINGIPVTVIGNSAFKGKNLTSVALPNSVITIENFAFNNNQLTSVYLGTGLTTIGDSAFNTNQLTTIDLPENLKSIGLMSFTYNQISSLVIPDSVTTIKGQAFRFNEINTVILGVGLTAIDYYAFADNLIKTAKVPRGVTTLSYGVFTSNPFTKVELPTGTTYTTTSFMSLMPTFPAGTVITRY